MPEFLEQIQSAAIHPFPNARGRHIDSTFLPIAGESEAVDSIFGAGNDATEEVSPSETQFRLLANALPQMVWIADENGRALYFNNKWYRYTGLSAEQSLIHEWTKTIHPDDLEQTAQKWKQALVTEEDLELECRFRGADGNYRWFLDRAYPARNSLGKVTRWFGTSTDIHDLIEAQSRFRAFFAQSSLPMEIYALDGTLLEANQAWAKLFDTNVENLSGYNVLTDPQIVALGITPLLERAIAGEAVDIPATYYDPAKIGRKGRSRWLEASFFPVKDRNGSVRELAMILRDVTDRRIAEDKLKESNDELEQAVSARQELLNICGHELKTPLCSLRLQAQTAKRRIAAGDAIAFEPKRVEKLVDIFDRQIDRLVHLVDDMLDLTRITSGRLHLSREKVALPKLVLEVLDRFSDQLTLAGCSIATSLAPDITGYWDRFRIEQVLNNLLTNALKYGKGAPITVTVKKSEDGKRAILGIKDQGMGIAPENHERIFNRFERAISANEVSGLGLGLFITREIVTMHGGTIRVESEPGKGATFLVELPVSELC